MKSLFPYLIIVFLFLIPATKVHGQLSQYAIGDTGNELATKVRYLPSERATIIAGYSYNYVDSMVSNYQAILMKIDSTGAIKWQKTFGIPGTNNIIKDMIITGDGNIVIVGTVGDTSTYSGNTAAILKYKSHDGSLMWQNCFRDAAMTPGGEFFYSVTEISGGRLVAVGDHNITPAGSGGMICVFQSNGTLMYNEVDHVLAVAVEYYGVASSADGNSVYICGIVPGVTYKDGILLAYTPGTTSGTINWFKSFEFGLMGSLHNNFFSSIYVSGSKLVISGFCLLNYSAPAGPFQHFVMTANSADGGGAHIISIQNNHANFGNTPAIALVDSDHIFTIQSPSSAYYDATTWITGVSTNTVVNEITSISSGTARAPVEFLTSETGQHSFLDMRYDSGVLHFAGSTNVPSGFGKNDIYYVVSGTALASLNHDCDTAHETINMETSPFTNPAASYTVSGFTPAYATVDTGSTHFGIKLLCGDSVSTSHDSTSHDSTSNVNRVVVSPLLIYPDPVQSTFTVVSSSQITSIAITDLSGHLTGNYEFSSNKVQLDVSDLAAGVYLVRINGTVVRKFVKQ